MLLDEIEIKKIVYGGYGLGFAHNTTYFIPFTLPNETVIIESVKNAKKSVFTLPLTIKEHSKNRILPPCPVFSQCGGCSYQHMNYDFEITLKKEQIVEQLRRISRLEYSGKIETIYNDRFHYRSIAGIKFSDKKYGFYRQNTNELVPLPENGCLLLNNFLNNFLLNIQKPMNNFRLSSDNRNQLFTHSDSIVTETVNGINYRRANRSFFQANQILREKMVLKVIELLDLTKRDEVLDAGCGVGFFSLQAARFAKSTRGFDSEKDSIKRANENAELNTITNTEFFTGSFHSIQIKNENKLVVDPPRSGVPKKFIQKILNSKIETICYISCDPSTWARDIHYLSERFTLKHITLIDMFPATYHIEVISLLERI
jgi:23S rRNA (uracil1939-C5)-methyltransferase